MNGAQDKMDDCKAPLWVIAFLLYLSLLQSCSYDPVPAHLQSINSTLNEINLTLIRK